jgi:hypothetical protein
MKKKRVVYINRKDKNYRETVDEFEEYKEALKILKEYQISDCTAEYYLSQRCCGNWGG